MDKKLFLSIVVVTWNNENFIEQSLKSCIDESVKEKYEIIVVHNASTDRTSELIQRTIFGHEELFVIIENKKNVGLAIARNIGMERAKGEYITFLDGDDWYEKGSIKKMISSLRKNTPDILMFNHQRFWPSGRTAVNILSYLLVERDASSVQDKNLILDNFTVAWNKAYRLDYLKYMGLFFYDLKYEDIAWSLPLIVFSEKVYVIPDVLVNYRQREGSILRSVNDEHFDAITQAYNLLEILKKDDAAFKLYGKTIYFHIRNILVGIVDRRNRLPKSSEGRFLKEMAKALKEWKEPLSNPLPKDKSLEIASLGSAKLYFFLKKVLGYHKQLKKIISKAKSIFKIFIYKWVFCKLPINKKKVFAESYWGIKASCNPLILANEIVKQTDYIVYFGLKKSASIDNDFPHKVARIKTIPYYYHLATSKYFITNANFRDEFIKRKNTIHIQTHHGTPLKAMGLDIMKQQPLYTDWTRLAHRSLRWDYMISSNPFSSTIWRQAAPFDYKIIESGYPRNDVLFSTNKEDVDNIKEKLKIPKGKKVALYAPTFRDNDKLGLSRPPINLEEITDMLGDDYVMLYRSHYFLSSINFDNSKNSMIINVSNYPTSEDIFLVSDILITDYSSSMFDFACLKRPIIIFTYDYDRYVTNRGLYFDIRKKAPGAVANSSEELKEILQSKEFESEENYIRLEEFNREFCPWDDGNASKRVIENVFLDSQ